MCKKYKVHNKYIQWKINGLIEIYKYMNYVITPIKMDVVQDTYKG